MKRYLTLALAVIMMLSLLACGGKTEEPAAEPAVVEQPTEAPTEEPAPEAKGIVDTWTLTSMVGEGVTMDAAAFGLTMTFTFNEDGTVVVVAYGEEENDTYTFADNTLVIVSEGTEIPGTYDPETDTIVLEQDGVKLSLARGGEPEVKETATAAPAVKGDVETVGTWTLTKALVSGVEVTAETMGQSMEFTFNADGSASMVYNGEGTDGLNWAEADGIVKLTAYGTDLYDFRYNDVTLVLHESQSGVDMIFEKLN